MSQPTETQQAMAHQSSEQRTIELVMPRGHTVAVHAIGSGQPIVLVHGFPLDATIWQRTLGPLVARGYHVLAPDLHGFGKSSAIEGPVTISDLAEDLEHMRRVLVGDQPIALAGLSLGGYVALEYWKQYASHLRQLVLSNTKPFADSPAARQGRLDMGQRALVDSTWSAVSPMLPKLLSQRTLENDLETTAQIKAMMAAVRPTTIAAIQQAMADRHDFSGELSMIHVPTLVITGEHDVISPPAENQEWAARIPSSQMHSIAGAAHLPMVEAANDFNQALLQFLN
ncbi:MAG: alpha/beta fold hydrolase [Pirellulaceae bacterium]|nr:alpha/beta fold hydrolase [Pirellulaceae bacterium]